METDLVSFCEVLALLLMADVKCAKRVHLSQQVTKSYSFLDYIFGGLQINFTVR